MTGMGFVQAERRCQVDVVCHDAHHEDEHSATVLGDAEKSFEGTRTAAALSPCVWPWDAAVWNFQGRDPKQI